jgi:plasmid segregation protein ParM
MAVNNESQQKKLIVNKDLILVGVDDGYAMTKVALSDGRVFKIPSRARAGSHNISTIGSAKDSVDGNYETDGVEFTVSEHIDGEGTRFNDYPFSSLNRVIVNHALRLAGLGGKSVKLATGLPVSHYFSGPGSKPNGAMIERKERNLKTPVKSMTGVACADIAATQVFAEGVAAWVDYTVNDHGEIINNLASPAAIIDIGGRTTDCVTVLPGWRVDHQRSGTANLGVLNLMETIANRVASKFDLLDFKASQLDTCLITGKIFLWNKEHDITDIILNAKKEIGDQIHREVQRRIGSGHDFSKVLFVGGGAMVFDGIQKFYPNAAMPNDPEYANARGMLKYMAHVI